MHRQPPKSAGDRSNARKVNVAFRLSIEDRALLQQLAHAEGVSVQAYLERKALGRHDATDLPPGPVRQKELPLAV